MIPDLVFGLSGGCSSSGRRQRDTGRRRHSDVMLATVSPSFEKIEDEERKTSAGEGEH